MSEDQRWSDEEIEAELADFVKREPEVNGDFDIAAMVNQLLADRKRLEIDLKAVNLSADLNHGIAMAESKKNADLQAQLAAMDELVDRRLTVLRGGGMRFEQDSKTLTASHLRHAARQSAESWTGMWEKPRE